jgi:hypothetical protein
MAADSDDRKFSGRLPLIIHFEGPAVVRRRLQLRDFLLFGREIQTALDRVARVLHGDKSSVRPGRRLAEIEDACSLDVVSFRGGGSATLTLDLPVLAQKVLPTYEDIGEESLRALISGLDTLSVDNSSLPQGYDDGVLMAIREAGKTFDRGVDRVSFALGAGRHRLAREITRETIEHIVRRVQAPTQNQKIIEGRLLMADFKESALRCRIHPVLGDPIICDFDEFKRDAVLSALTHLVRIVGEATLVEGAIRSLRIQDVEVLDEEGRTGDMGPPVARFETERPALESLGGENVARTMGELSDIGTGIWPEAEDVDEFIRSVRKWRREGGSDRLP